MIDSGFASNILFSTGSKGRVLGRGEQSLHNPSHLPRYFLPGLRKAGVGEETINQITVENPQKVLPIKYPRTGG
jgi:predicted metal-dependent phosphotriesterase family hydrolase